MQQEPARTLPSSVKSALRHVGTRRAGIAVLVLLCSFFLPVVAIFLGVFLIAAVAVHAWSFTLRPLVQPILRVPVGRPGKRRARLLAAAGAGALLVLSGSVGATIRGHLRTQWEQRATRREADDLQAVELLQRARDQLSLGNVEAAELVLIDADALVALDPARRAEVDDLLARVRLSRDRQAILGVLTQLPEEEFEAFAKGGEHVPAAIDFPEQALTYRAVEIAIEQIDAARTARARP
jgi:hypothetical protein